MNRLQFIRSLLAAPLAIKAVLKRPATPLPTMPKFTGGAPGYPVPEWMKSREGLDHMMARQNVVLHLRRRYNGERPAHWEGLSEAHAFRFMRMDGTGVTAQQIQAAYLVYWETRYDNPREAYYVNKNRVGGLGLMSLEELSEQIHRNCKHWRFMYGYGGTA